MAIGSDPLITLLIGSFVLIVGAMVLDELGRYLKPWVERYRVRLVAWRVTPRTLLPLIVALVLAILMHAPMISTYLVIVGGVITWHFLRRAKKQQGLLPARQIFQLVFAFRSMYQLQPAVFQTLDMAKEKVDEPLKSLVRIVVQTFFLTSSPERAFAELRKRTDNAYLSQFAYILEMSESASADAVIEALDNMVERLRVHDELRRSTEATLISITGQTSFMQAIAVLIVFAVALLPTLRAPYASTGGQIFFILVLTAMLAASYYIDLVVSKLTERIS